MGDTGTLKADLKQAVQLGMGGQAQEDVDVGAQSPVSGVSAPSTPPRPDNEVARLAALRHTGLLDSLREPAYDDITFLAAQVAQRPIALLSLIDRERQWIKSRFGAEIQEIPRHVAPCAHTILTTEQPLIVPDMRLDERFVDNPLVTGKPRIRSYAGVPIRDASKRFALGSLCVLGRDAFEPSPAQIASLWALARQVENLIAMRFAHRELEQYGREIQRTEQGSAPRGRDHSWMMASLSHQLRTPLNGVVGAVELLLRTQLSPHQLELVDAIDVSSSSMLYLVNDLLDLCKLDAGELVLRDDNVHLDRLTRSILDAVRPDAFGCEVKLKSHITEDVPPVIRCDEGRLHQALLSLIENAVRFTYQGEVELAVSAEEDFLQFTIRDTGVGIPEAELESIFEPFRQGSMAPSYVEGTGLGLAIVRRVAREMGGDVSVQSRVGAGSCFTLRIPLRLHSNSSFVQDPAFQRKSNEALRRVLVAEDNPTNRKIVSCMLGHLGVEEVLSAENGYEAVELAPQADLILMDCEMPIMDGLDATQQIREAEGDERRVPIVAITANAFESDRQRCLAAGMDGFLSKPVRWQQLLEVLTNLGFVPREPDSEED